MKQSPWIVTVAMLGLALLYVPLLVVAVMSFNATRHGQTWGGFTFDWYLRLFSNGDIGAAFMNSMLVAFASTLIATLLGTLLAIGMRRLPLRPRGRLTADVLMNLPTVTPDILLAAALVVAFGVFRQFSGMFSPGLTTLIIGHVTFEISFVAVVVASRLQAIGREQFEAARDLYASTWVAWWKVILPQLAPGIVAGALLAFTLSLDDFVVSFFISGPSSTTLPIIIYASVKRGVTPEIHALSTLMVLATMVIILGLVFLERRRAEPG